MLSSLQLATIESIRLTNFSDYRHWLKAVYLALKEQSNRYSYIQFTKECGLGDCNAIYLIIHGRRSLSLKLARKIAMATGLRGPDKRYFFAMVKQAHEESVPELNRAFEEMLAAKAQSLSREWDKQSLAFFSAWHHSAIYELLCIDEIPQDAVWIACHLRPSLSREAVEESLELLQSLGLVEYDEEKKRFFPRNKQISTGSEIRGFVFKSYHYQMIQLGLKSLADSNPAQRDISAVTISVSSSAIAQIKELTQEFRKRLLACGEAEPNAKEQIIQINIQAFPLTEKLEKNK